MKLIIGLGNPGLKYKKTWHNLGFITADLLADKYNFSKFKKDKKNSAEINEGEINGEKIILAKPLTYMNESGRACRSLLDYYKIDIDNLIVIHDDIDLPLGKVKAVKESGSGGHNGVKSIFQYLGEINISRIKIGVNTKLRQQIPAEKYVLMKIDKEHKNIINESLEKAVSIISEQLQ